MKKSLENRIKLVNKWILHHRAINVYAVETDSTWETIYLFEEITVKDKYVYVNYLEGYNKRKTKKD